MLITNNVIMMPNWECQLDGLCFLVAYQLNSLFIFMMLFLFNVQLRNKYMMMMMMFLYWSLSSYCIIS